MISGGFRSPCDPIENWPKNGEFKDSSLDQKNWEAEFVKFKAKSDHTIDG